MSEERVSRPMVSDASVRRADGTAHQMSRVTTLRRFVIAFAVVGFVSLGFFSAVWLRTGAWQMVVPGGAVLLGLLLAPLALFLAQRGQIDLAGYIVLFALVTIYLAGELTWSQATPYLVASGALVILFGGAALLPRKWGSWFALLGAFALAVFLINQYQPLQRLDIQQSPILGAYVPILGTILAAVMLWRAFRAYREVSTIRARLLVVSVGTVVLTAVAITAGTIIIGFRNGRDQAIDRLQLVAMLREVEIEGWSADVRGRLGESVDQAPEQRYVEAEVAEITTALIDMPQDSVEYQEAYDALLFRFNEWLDRTPSFHTVFFLNRDGEVLVSSDPELEGQVLAEETYFQRGTVRSFVAPLAYDDALGQAAVLVSRPLLGEYGRLLGVVAGRADAIALEEVMRLEEQGGLGSTGETYLVGEDRRLLTPARASETGKRMQTQAVQEVLTSKEGGFGDYPNYQDRSVIGVYRWLPDLEVALIAEQGRAEALQAVNRTAVLNGTIAVVAVLAAGAISLSIAQGIGGPLNELARVASDIAAGNLNRMASVDRRDEIGTLAEAFNTMTARLRGLIGQLEQRVAERTEQLETRSAYLEASAEVGHAASAVLDADELTEDVVDLVRERFGLYYVGLFLLDEMGEWAELRAGTGEAGEQMLLQGHRLRAGGESMIGQCVSRGEARIALDVGDEAVRFDNPLLPNTRSEAALPLQSRGRMFGAITVQSEEPAAFDEDTLTVLQTMADQVAVALDNAYLFAEAQSAIEAARRASGEVSRHAWSELLQAPPVVGYHCDDRGVVSAGGIWRPEMERAVREQDVVCFGSDDGSDGGGDQQPLAVPITVADKVIAVLHTYKPAHAGSWTDEEIETLRSLAERLGVSLESARLYQETQRRAERDRLTAEISSRVWSSSDVDTILRTAVHELGRSLQASDAWIELEPGNGASGDGGPRDDERWVLRGNGDGSDRGEPTRGGEE